MEGVVALGGGVGGAWVHDGERDDFGVCASVAVDLDGVVCRAFGERDDALVEGSVWVILGCPCS